ncbi:hypothetical protein [Beijerinckia sp. L45]|uniref:hypothetical protein n=1 Tax=Beijerinckia sp. L45 TaxID=1641855 RepID=UPI00131E7982|nr:hypothetical protein [Beijerinckia sp. L45]
MIDLKAMRAGHASRMSAQHRDAFDAKMASLDAERLAYDQEAAQRRKARIDRADVAVGSPDDPMFAADLIAAVTRAAATARVIVLQFPDHAELRDLNPAATPAMIDLLVVLANLAAEQRCLTLACVSAPIGGALLEVALRCDILAVAPDVDVAFSHAGPHAAGIYAILAERLGFMACEQLFRHGPVKGTALFQQGLALYCADSFDGVVDQVVKKASTMIALFAASRLSFAVSRDVVATLHS